MKRDDDGGTAFPALLEHQGFQFHAPGMTIFDYASVACLRGLLSRSGEGLLDPPDAAEMAIGYARELVRQLNQHATSE
jgi:hypothetical protein